MRHFLAILALVALVLPLAGCCSGEPTLELRSPVWPGMKPTLVPQGYAIQQPTAPALMAVPYAAAPQVYAAPCAPAAGVCAPAPAAGYTPGYQYAAPPVPRAAGAPCQP